MHGASTKLAVAVSLGLLACLLFAANGWAGTAAPRSVTRAMRSYVRVHLIRDRYAEGPISVTCNRVTARRFKCSWRTGPTGPGGSREDYGGRADVVRRGRKLLVTRLVITCSPDGAHDVCPTPPLTLAR